MSRSRSWPVPGFVFWPGVLTCCSDVRCWPLLHGLPRICTCGPISFSRRVSSVGGWFVFWIALGQIIWHLGAFIRNAAAMVSGYEHALGIEEPERVLGRGVAVALLLFAIALLRLMPIWRRGRSGLGKIMFLAWALFFG